MLQDLLSLVHRTRVLIEVSEELCSGSMRTIQRSKRLLETIDAERGSQQNAQPPRRSQPAKLDSPGCRKNP
jgi:hypothetical protein